MQSSDGIGRRAAIATAVAALLALVTWARLALVASLYDQGWFAKYVELADRTVGGAIPLDRIGDISPAYFWLMVVMRWAGLAVETIRDLQIAGVTVAALCCLVAAWRVGGAIAGVGAAALLLLNRSALVISTELEPETLILLLNASAILLVVVWQTTGRTIAAAGAGFLLGLSTTARPVAAGIVVLLALAMLFRSRKAALMMVAASLVPVAGILLVNRALTGNVFIMQPGSQFLDGNNPLATGCAGVLPRIIADFNTTSPEPDYLHAAYRIVAARATNTSVDAKRSNRYWSSKALAFVREYPMRALSLFGWKAVMSVHNYDIYDLRTTKLKGVELARYPAVPFGTILLLASTAFVLHVRRRELLPIALFSCGTLFALVLFNVSARQRMALLAPATVLGGVACAAIAHEMKERPRRGSIAIGAVVAGTLLLGVDVRPARENDYGWLATVSASNARAQANAMWKKGARREAAGLAALSSILEPARPPLVPAPVLRETAWQIAHTASDARRFDAAIALQKSGAWRESDVVLRDLAAYAPLRENRAVSSVAYYRARAAIRLRAQPQVVDSLLDLANLEAPGDPNVLALRAVRGDRHSGDVLDRLNDPFTRDFVLAAAYADMGDPKRAEALLTGIERSMPEWGRPELLRREMRFPP